MTRWIIGTSLQFRRLVIAAAVALMALGITQLKDAPVEALPEFGPTRVEVQTESLGLSAEEVEQLITTPMEQQLFNGLPWAKQIRSNSISGLSSIEMLFEPGTDVMAARQVVQERFSLTPILPKASSRPPFVIQPVSSTSRLMLIGLSSKELSQIDVGVLARWKLQPRLLGVPGVANVAIWGHRDRQLQVQVDPAQLKQKGVTLDQVVRTAGNAMWVSPLTFIRASTPGNGGFLDTPNQRIDIQHTQPIRSPQDLAKVPIEGAKDASVHLGDVAHVVEDYQPLIGDAVVNESPNMLLVVERFPGTDVADVTRGLEHALDEMRPGLTGLNVDTVYRPATFIENALVNLTTTTIIGVILLILALGAFLFDWRAALISVVTISLSLAAALMVLASFGVTFNLLILAGLVMALAIVVDDAVIGVDNVRRRLRENREDGTILAAAAEMRGPMLTATLITAVSVVPVVLVGAVNGSFLKPLGYTYALTVLVSTVIAMTVAPALAMVLLSKTSLKHRESPLARWLGRGYTTLLTRLLAVRLSWSFAAAGVAVLVLASGLAGWLMIGSKPVTPVLQDRSLLIRWDGMPGTSLPEMDRITAAASRELRSVPGVRNVGAVMGRAVASDQVSNVNTGELWVTLDSTADYASTSAAVQGVVSGYPGLAHELQTYQNQQLQKTDTRSGKPVLVRVYGYDFNVLRSKADEVAHVMSQVDGVSNAKVQAQSQEPTVEVEVAADKAASHGIKPGEVRRAAATLMSGITAGVLYEQQKVFDVVVRSTPETRANLTSLSDLLIDKPDGGQVRLGDVATVQIRPNPVSISHNGASRSIDVVADAMGRDVGSVTRDLEHRLQQISFPREHHLEVLSDAVQKQGAHQRTLLYGLAAVIALFFLLQASFSSWRLASILLPVLPAALAGGVLMALRPDGTMSVVALMGLLGVLAIATRTGILMIKSFQRLEAEGEALGPDLVLRGAQERFVPIVTTVLATGLALTPLVIYGNRAGLEMANPMAAIILGGLISTALVVLFGLPALFLRFGARHTKHAEQNSGQPAARGA